VPTKTTAFSDAARRPRPPPGRSGCADVRIRFSCPIRDDSAARRPPTCRNRRRPLKKSISPAAIRSMRFCDVHTARLTASARTSREICCGETRLRNRPQTFQRCRREAIRAGALRLSPAALLGVVRTSCRRTTGPCQRRPRPSARNRRTPRPAGRRFCPLRRPSLAAEAEHTVTRAHDQEPKTHGGHKDRKRSRFDVRVVSEHHDRWTRYPLPTIFVALRSHYLFASQFTTSGIEGAHDGGGVEGEVGRLGRNHLVPSLAGLAHARDGLAASA